MNRFLGISLLLVLMPMRASAIDYPYSTAEPQKSGWPLTAEERAYVVDKPEHDRRPVMAVVPCLNNALRIKHWQPLRFVVDRPRGQAR